MVAVVLWMRTPGVLLRPRAGWVVACYKTALLPPARATRASLER